MLWRKGILLMWLELFMEQRNQTGKPGARSCLWSRGTKQVNLELGVVYGAEEPDR